MSKSTTLTMAHNIWLTKEQRHELQNFIPVTVVGSCCSVWFHQGTTSEPASEVMCQYTIGSDKDELCLLHTANGFHIDIPKSNTVLHTNLPATDKEHLPIAPAVSALKDFKDGGSEWFFFRQYSRIKRKVDNVYIDLLHIVEIKDMKLLTKTLC